VEGGVGCVGCVQECAAHAESLLSRMHVQMLHPAWAKRNVTDDIASLGNPYITVTKNDSSEIPFVFFGCVQIG